jgi:ABC-type phosphate/phosphonate transport system substrate-binding protein
MEKGVARDVSFAVNYQYLLEAMKEDQMDVSVYGSKLGKKIYFSTGDYTAVVMGMEEE